MKNKLILFLILVSCVFSVGFTYNDNTKTVNPEYLEYEKLSDEEKSKINLIPNQYITYYPIEKNIKYNYFKSSIYPTTYDLRNVNGNNYITPIDNQGSSGLCWAFASNNSLESYLLKSGKGQYNFSERQLDYALSVDGVKDKNIFNERYLLDGGQSFMVNRIWSTEYGPVTEEVFGPFNLNTTIKEYADVMSRDNVSIDVKSTVHYRALDFDTMENVLTNEEFKEMTMEYVNTIKNHIMQYGAVYTAIYWYFYNPTTNFLYNNGNSSYSAYANTGHAATIIGWDDNYKDIDGDGVKEGAWLAQNSWGSTYSYYYISYYDRSSVINFMGVTGAEEKDWNDVIDNYEIISQTQNGYYSENETQVKFTKLNVEETLNEMKINADIYDSNLEYCPISIYYKENDNDDYVLLKTQNIYRGINTIDFEDFNTSSEEFTIKYVSKASMTTFVVNGNISAPIVKEITRKGQSASEYNVNNRVYTFNVNTKGISSNTVLDVKVISDDNEDITSSFVVSGNTVHDNTCKIKLSVHDTTNLYDGNATITVSSDTASLDTNIKLIKLDGLGTQASPFIISDLDDLLSVGVSLEEYYDNQDYYMSNNNCGGNKFYYTINNDIGILNKSIIDGWEGKYICNTNINGNGYTIYGLYDSTGGLFSVVDNSTISNINMDYVGITIDKANTSVTNTYRDLMKAYGPLANYIIESELSNISILENTYVQQIDTLLGGIVGASIDSKITNSYSKAHLTSTAGYVGGIAGMLELSDNYMYSNINAIIKNTYFMGNITNLPIVEGKTINKGGIVGLLQTYRYDNSDHFNSVNSDVYVSFELNNNYYNEATGCTKVYSTYVNYYDLYGYDIGESLNNSKLYMNVGQEDPVEIINRFSNNNLINSSNNKIKETYIGFDFDNIWDISEDSTPYLRSIKPVIMTTNYVLVNSITEEEDMNKMYVGENIEFSVIYKPLNATYKDSKLRYTLNDNDIIDVIDNKDSLQIEAKNTGSFNIIIDVVGDSFVKPITISNVSLSTDFYEYESTNEIIIPSGQENSDIDVNLVYDARSLVILHRDIYSDYVGSGSEIKACASNDVCSTLKVVVYGDVNGDGEKDIYDIINLTKDIVGLQSITNPQMIKASDVEKDSEIDIYDIIKLTKSVVGIGE